LEGGREYANETAKLAQKKLLSLSLMSAVQAARMSWAARLDKNRALKRIAAENRHLHARLVNNCVSSTPQGRIGSLGGCSPILYTRPVDKAAHWFESSVYFPIHDRCHILGAVNTCDSSEGSILNALTEALFIVPTSVEWNRILKVCDSDLFVEFTRLLKCLNATAEVQLARNASPHSSPTHSTSSSAVGRARQEYKATISVELPSIDETDATTLSCTNAPSELRAQDADRALHNSGGARALKQKLSRHYDLGVSGNWAISVRDAIKLAVAKSFNTLEDCVADEWREAGKEAALLLNELFYGGCSTSEMDVRHLNDALRGDKLPRSFHTSDDCDESVKESRVRWTVRSRPTNSSDEHPRCVQGVGETFPAGLADDNECLTCHVDVLGARLGTGPGDGQSVPKVVEYIVCKVSTARLKTQRERSIFITGVGTRQPSSPTQWEQRCLSGAVLLSLAVQRSALYRCCTPNIDRKLDDLTVSADRLAHHAVLASQHSLSEATWSFPTRFAVLSSITLSEESAVAASRSINHSANAVTLPCPVASSQNSWSCPDVVVMVAMMRSTLRLSHDSFPEIRFKQKAVHDPARRVHELMMGQYGDVDVLTTVSVTWATPRGTFVATAESDPALHATLNTVQEGSSQWLSCRDTGYSRGPLPLLVAAVCSLFDQVMEACSSPLQSYPLVPIHNAFSRRGLDFLLYSWFGATPQVHCFAIGTAAPKAQAKSTAASHLWNTPDGFTSNDLGPCMTRAMLFYDVLGQRVLFAETHASDVAAAVLRLDELAMEVNQLRQDAHISVSATRRRPFRSIARLQRWRAACVSFARAAASQVIPALPVSVSHVQSVALAASALPSPSLDHLLRRCIEASGSELSALWTVVEVLAKAMMAVSSPITSHSSAMNIDSDAAKKGGNAVAARFLPDRMICNHSAGARSCLADKEETEEELFLWLGRHHVPWNCRPLGKEATPPSAGVVELRVQTSIPTTCDHDAAGGEGELFYVAFRCRVEPLSSGSSNSGGDSPVPTGVIPALTLLCREALQYLYAEDKKSCMSLTKKLPPVDEVLRRCVAADPVLARAKDGFPPYDARFYAAPKLLGELLQGIVGKYSCSYASAAAPLRASAMAANTFARLDAVSGPSSSLPPSTVFYRSEALAVEQQQLQNPEKTDDSTPYGSDRDDPWGVARRESAAQSAPPSVECVVFIDNFFGGDIHNRGGHANSTLRREDSTVCGVSSTGGDAVTSNSGFILGRGVGRTKREAWRSAAWQALRLQFPRVLAQLDVLRSVAELTQHPDQLNLLCNNTDHHCTNQLNQVEPLPSSPATTVCGLVWRWKTARVSAAPHEHRGDRYTTFPTHDQTSFLSGGSACSVDLVHTDGSQSPLPEVTSIATTAGEAYVLAGRKLLHCVHEVHRKSNASSSPSSSVPSPSDTAVRGTGTTWWPLNVRGLEPAAPQTVLRTAPGNRERYYSTWRHTTHYTRSVWHAYVGALSLYFDKDMKVELLCDTYDEEEVECGGTTKQRAASTSSVPLAEQLSAVQVSPRRTNADDYSFSPLQRTAAPLPSSGGVSAPCGNTHAHAHCADPSDAVSKLLFRQTPASLLARHRTLQRSSTPPSVDSPLTPEASLSTSSLQAHGVAPPFVLLRATTRWLCDLVEQCAVPRRTCEELRGLLCSRRRDIQRIQRVSRWTPLERTEAIVMRWTGCHAVVRLRRSSLSSSTTGTSAVALCTEPVWVAEMLLHARVSGLRRNVHGCGGRGAASLGTELHWTAPVRTVESGMWVAGRAAGATSDDAAWKLYRDLCHAVRDVGE
jgi:hypothetical protein